MPSDSLDAFAWIFHGWFTNIGAIINCLGVSEVFIKNVLDDKQRQNTRKCEQWAYFLGCTLSPCLVNVFNKMNDDLRVEIVVEIMSWFKRFI